MKIAVALLALLFGAALATAQKQDPILLRSHPAKRVSTAKSQGPGAVQAVLNRKSTTANDLAKIERGPVNQRNASKPASAPVRSNAAKNFGVGQENKNKPMTMKPGGAAHSPVHRKSS